MGGGRKKEKEREGTIKYENTLSFFPFSFSSYLLYIFFPLSLLFFEKLRIHSVAIDLGDLQKKNFWKKRKFTGNEEDKKTLYCRVPPKKKKGINTTTIKAFRTIKKGSKKIGGVGGI